MKPSKEERKKMAFENWLIDHETVETGRWIKLTTDEMEYLAAWYWEEFQKRLEHYRK